MFLIQKRILLAVCFKKKFVISNLLLGDLHIETDFDLFFKALIRETICHRPQDLFSDGHVASRRTQRGQVRGKI